MKCLKCSFNNSSNDKYCSNCGSKLDNNIVSLVLSCISFVLLTPMVLLILMFYNDSCNLILWLMFITFFIPSVISGICFSLFPNIAFFSTNMFIGLTYVIFQFILNTIAFVRLLFNPNKKCLIFYISLILIIFNYIIIVFFVWYYSNIGGCHSF